MQIDEVSEILGLCHFLRAPKHVFITEEKVWSNENGKTHYRGLQPKTKDDSILLSAQADPSTPIHESVHAVLGVDEIGAEILTRAIMRKNEVLKAFPLLKQVISKEVRYKKVEASREYPWAHGEKFSGRVEHYVLVQSDEW